MKQNRETQLAALFSSSSSRSEAKYEDIDEENGAIVGKVAPARNAKLTE